MSDEKQTGGLFALASVPLVMTLGNSMLIPVLPTMGRELDVSAFMISLLITVYSVVAILCIPLAGYLSDHIGRKHVIIPSLFIAGLGGLIAGFAGWKMEEPYWVILIGRFLQGIGAAGAAPIVMPFVGDLFTDKRQVSEGLGMIETLNTFGKVLSPIFGALLASIVWFMPFFAFPLFCILSILLLLLLVKSPPLSQKSVPFGKFIETVKTIFKREGRWLYIVFIVGCLVMYILFGVLFYLSTHLEETHQVHDIPKGVILAFPLMALCITSYVSGRAIGQDQMKMKWMTVVGLFLLFVSILVVALKQDIYIMLTALFVAGMGIGAVLPSLDAFVTEGIPIEQRGSITSLYNSMRFVGVATGPPLFSLFMKGSHFWMFAMNACIVFAAVIVVYFGIRPKKTSVRTWR
ncbi:MFS transporter [Shouchella lonarensis]|uniref:MFS transporter, ACDE family, multidrug resistance protein n=1 Tax=Shouchella lonarensis TaxID=1464122 RepID=A0A1G6MG73_9BACI|nr:MFS transporter [Shouchella lonarensis]SDC54264.1 MFS transporter, ACDE family, multidrug resistance protein [Shouchella lonarensis]